jgi:hypothetical protein
MSLLPSCEAISISRAPQVGQTGLHSSATFRISQREPKLKRGVHGVFLL